MRRIEEHPILFNKLEKKGVGVKLTGHAKTITKQKGFAPFSVEVKEYKRGTSTHTAQIILFLNTLKRAIEERRYVIICRNKNNAFLSDHGMTPTEREEIIHGLQVDDYISGSEEDRDYPGEKDIWKFKKEYLGYEIYIKIKFVLLGDSFFVKGLSFHS